ncbi:putative 4-coumarate--CoA ligase [Rhypophila decipiens]|uniref:4-coumarate--CoA ligase n=1 Tax=Rhypophila decipiens TaxID=261697 RepID=A0AAN6YD60_9PEZI|nr:putative 4-coumarate--CoA ligase [Rhypophila decipiens]
MTIKSRWEVDIPRCSLQQWIFGSATGPVPNHKAFLDPEAPETNYLTMGDYRLLSKRVALGLLKLGLQPGERVLVFSGNSIFYPSVFLGVLAAGGIFTGANPGFVARELAYQLRDSDARFLFVAEAALPTALEAAKEVGLSHDNIFILGGKVGPASELTNTSNPQPASQGRVSGIRHWTELIAGNLSQAQKWSWTEPADPENTTCCLNYSSGTTGVPKGVEISHYAYVSNGTGVEFTDNLDPEVETKRLRRRALAFLPMYHAYGQTYFVANFPRILTPVYVMPSFDYIKMLEYIQKYRITTLSCVPPIVVLLTKHPLTKNYDLSSIEQIGSGAAPLSIEVTEECQKLLPGNVSLKQGWGMTEVTCTAMSWDPKYKGTSAGVGEMMPNCAAKIMSLDGKTEILEAQERGELWITGPTLLRSYWNKPQATAETMHIDPDGTRWLKTGDIAFVDEYKPGGIFHVVDRIKELIKVKGNQVAPAELEGILLDFKEVADAAVVGVTIDGEEVPRAYVVKKDGSSVTEEDVAKWMAGQVAKYKQLRGGVKFVGEIPKNPSGKILRKILREAAKAEVGDKTPQSSKL